MKNNESVNHPYKVTVTGRHVHITESMKQYVLDKIAKMEKLSHKIIEVIVIMDIRKIDHVIDVILKFEHFKIQAEAITTDMYASIDKVVNKLQTQLRRFKTKIHKHSGHAVEMFEAVPVHVDKEECSVEDVNKAIESETCEQLEKMYHPGTIVTQKKIVPKMLKYEEAVNKLESQGYNFFVFLCEEDQVCKILYKKENNNYGILEIKEH